MPDFQVAKIEIFIPKDHIDLLLDALSEVGAGEIGNYDHCSSISSVRGTWRPLPGASPYDGEVGHLSSATEAKVEVNCRRERIPAALQAIRRIHPYEEPVINVIPLANHLFE
jgi:hypothetical protein